MKSSHYFGKITPLALIFIAILAISTASPLIRLAQREAPSIIVAVYRIGFASLLLFPFAAERGIKAISRLEIRNKALLVLAGLLLALHFASWISSLQYTSIASSVVLVTTTPLWVAVLSPLFLHEKLSPKAWVGLGIALFGGVIVGLSSQCSWGTRALQCDNLLQFDGATNTMGNFLALLGAWCGAGYLLIGRRLRSSLNLTAYTFGVYGLSSVFLLLGVWVTGNSMTGYRPLAYGWFLALAVIPQLVGHSTLNWSLKYLSASYVSIALLGEPIGAIILSFFFLGEKPASMELAGGILILAGIYIATSMESKKLEMMESLSN
ncbi:MAG: EamA family transporter [Anaerolineaceae bacterium]|nr:EamA family transporter [Anaerolineaceae bacterium]